MIQINLDRRADIEDLNNRHWNYFSTYRAAKLKKAFDLRPMWNLEKKFYSYLMNNIKKIIIGSPSSLNEVIQHVGRKYNALDFGNNGLGPELNSIFDYNAFSKGTKNWGAYQLVEGLKINVCPYCNRQYIHTFSSKSGKARATLDHFFDKDTYPYLSISFFNLIPSCSTCNSSLKGRKPFTYDDNLHPYENGLSDLLRFSIQLRARKVLPDGTKDYDFDFFYGAESSYNLKLKINKVRKPSVSLLKKGFNNAKVFHITELYAFHKDYVDDLIKCSILYNQSKIDDLYNEFEGKLFNSREDVLRTIVHNYVVEQDVDKRVLAKLAWDITTELGLL